MGRTKNGVNGTVSGKVGAVVFYERNGKSCVRAAPHFKKTKKPSLNQLQARKRFNMVHQYLSRMLPVIRLGFKINERNIPAYNAAMSYNLKHAILEENNQFKLDYAKFSISRGIHIQDLEVSMSHSSSSLFIHWSYDKTSLPLHVASKFKCMVMYLNDEKDMYVAGDLLSSQMIDMAVTLPLSTSLTKGAYQVYVAFVAIDGTNRSSDSVYVGRFDVS